MMAFDFLFGLFESGVLDYYYGEKFQGKPTASGEPFDAAGFTAAHRKLPFGTELEVSRADDGRTVKVRVNDRGPFADDRVLDVSKAAAEKLGMIDDGVVEVKVKILSQPKS